MSDALLQLGLFSFKAVILVLLLLLLLAGILSLLGRGKDKLRGKMTIKNLNKKYSETADTLLEDVLPKKEFKQYLKKQKNIKKSTAAQRAQKNIFVVHFQGDIRASAVTALREEVTAILSIATPKDEVVICVESAGGMVHAYGLAAAQLSRIKQQKIPLTVIVDKVAASGGYLMACVANKILAAPFAIIGSIGVIVQLPNFHRLLKEKNIDFEQLTAGNYKRTITLFGHNTEEGREKLKEEIDEIHHLFKNAIQQNRPQIDIEKVSTGEHWLGTQALELQLVDDLKTSDDYLFSQSKQANLFEIQYQIKKSLAEKLGIGAQTLLKQAVLEEPIIPI
ncbi:MAG TPA: protease SohB [Gammaproteobacteria bacterium]|nr:protease SohB [Gammaproteobacteria bacterium]